MFRLPKMRTHPHIPQGMSSDIAEIIVAWSLLDKTMDVLNEVLELQPECQQTSPNRDAPFRRRANRFNELSRVYFATCPATVKFLDQFYNSLLMIQDERDMVAHGRYGVVMHGPDFALTLTANFQGHTTRIYTPDELADLKLRVTRHLAVFMVLAYPSQFEAFPDILTSQWRIPQPQADLSRKLLDRIHDLCQKTILEQCPQLPEWPYGASVYDPSYTIVPKE